ncbi:LamG-like jellyroll fold domain-containing protein [Streptomyces sp. CAU 1734]|uniref:LamG-like jellyroll fold domain-containing protein n=1 Tax=Streptomyces sp. CAU 1734 TaxID=3140360 RepID=UPI0032604BF4
MRLSALVSGMVTALVASAALALPGTVASASPVPADGAVASGALGQGNVESTTVPFDRKGYWPLESAPGGASPNIQSSGTSPGQPLRLRGAAHLYHPADVFDDSALTDSGHLTLNGTTDWADTDNPVLSGATSYTLGVRVRPNLLDPTRSQTVLSVPGQYKDRVAIRYEGTTQKWQLSVTTADSPTAETVTITADEQFPSADGSGQHLAVVYNAVTQELRFHVDGSQWTAPGVTVSGNAPLPSTGGLQVGRSAQGGGSEYLAGAIDEVRAYAQAVDAITLSRMSALTGDPSL